jgi:PhzF family phenazine biosynthesis protein
MQLLKIAAFCADDRGGNPAGVVLADDLPSEGDMQGIAADVGFSETAFAAPVADGWRVRYFSPAAEIPFCGHATIALGAALASERGEGAYALVLNQARLEVKGFRQGELWAASLMSPQTRSAGLPESTVLAAATLLGYTLEDLDPRLPPALIHAGADHLFMALRRRDRLAAMRYDFDAGQAFMRKFGLVTIMLAHAQTATLFNARNAFAFGGVYEDPATGAAAAALGGYLRDLAWAHGGSISVRQGDDMGVPCRIEAEIGAGQGAPVRVSGTARFMAGRGGV